MKAETLLANADFIRNLARSLVMDEHFADDLVQETWLIAMRRAPMETQFLRSWLYKVVRNLSFNLQRKERRRSAHEKAAASDATLDSFDTPEDLLARRTLLIQLMEAVVSLREPYRSAIILRYYQNIPPREIAKQLDIPVESVKTRLKRGLTQLRKQLDEVSGGEPNRWAMVLAPLVGLVPGKDGSTFVPAPETPSLSSRIATWAGTVAVTGLVVTSLYLFFADRQPDPVGEGEVPQVTATQENHETGSQPSEPTLAASGRIPNESLEVSTHREKINPSRESVDQEPGIPIKNTMAEINGRILSPQRVPVEGAVVELQGWSGDSRWEAEFGPNNDWKNIKATTNESGFFAVHFDPPPSFQFSLFIIHPGLVAASWRWKTINPGTVIPLGDVPLVQGGNVIGKVLDQDGRPILGGFTVGGSLVHAQTAGRHRYTKVFADPDETTGEFVLRDLPPGPCKIWAYFDDTGYYADWPDGPSLDVIPNDTVEVELFYRNHDPLSSIRVLTSTSVTHFLNPEPRHVKLMHPIDGTIRGDECDHEYGTFQFNNLSPEPYTLEINDPRFMPWRREGIYPGSGLVSVHLTGSSGINLELLDKETGDYLRSFTLSTEIIAPYDRPEVHLIQQLGDIAEARERITGLVPVDQTLIIRSPGYARVRVPLKGLKPGEYRDIKIEMESEGRICGLLTNQEGTPLPWYEIWLSMKKPETPVKHRFEKYDDLFALTRADHEGCFVFDELPPGQYWIGPSPGFPVLSEYPDVNIAPAAKFIEVTERSIDTECLLIVYEDLYIEGSVVNRSGHSMEALLVEAISDSGYSSKDRCDDEGNFKIGPLVPGVYTINSVDEKIFTYHPPSYPVTACPGDEGVVLVVEPCGPECGVHED